MYTYRARPFIGEMMERRLTGVIGPMAAGLFSNSASSEAPQHLQLREFRATGRRRRNGAEVLRNLGRGAGQ